MVSILRSTSFGWSIRGCYNGHMRPQDTSKGLDILSEVSNGSCCAKSRSGQHSNQDIGKTSVI